MLFIRLQRDLESGQGNWHSRSAMHKKVVYKFGLIFKDIAHFLFEAICVQRCMHGCYALFANPNFFVLPPICSAHNLHALWNTLYSPDIYIVTSDVYAWWRNSLEIVFGKNRRQNRHPSYFCPTLSWSAPMLNIQYLRVSFTYSSIENYAKTQFFKSNLLLYYS